jgi:cytochrome c peroxidase
VARLLRGDADLACRYRNAFGRAVPPEAAAETALVDAAKALAAYLETLVSGPSAFDEFRDALARGDAAEVARYPAAARRGLALFAGKGQCSVCHFGPNFSNGEFHNIGRPHLVEPGRVDPGRHGGIRRVREDKYNLLGAFSDDATRASGSRTRHLAENHANYGQFKVPSLRNVELTAPYMHDGRLATLREVVRHYSELNQDRLHQDGEALLKPLRLSDEESEDLVAFLRSLTSRSFPDLNPAPGPCRRRGS